MRVELHLSAPKFKHFLAFAAATIVVCSVSTIVRETRYNKRFFYLNSLLIDFTVETSSTSTTTTTTTKQKQRLCSREEIRHGQWLPVILDKPPYIPDYSKCYEKESLEEATSWKYYRWHPFASTITSAATTALPYNGYTTTSTPMDVSTTWNSSIAEPCDYSQWNSTLFCELSCNKTIAFMGDSLAYEQFASLAGLLGVSTLGRFDKLQWVRDGKVYADQQAGMTFPVCDGHSKVSFLRHRYLLKLKDLIGFANPDVLVLNRGAHYVNDKQLIKGMPKSLGIEEVANVLSEWQEEDESCSKKECLAIWRTSSPGHPHCQSFTEPATSVEEMEQLVGTRENNSYWKHHHYEFKHQNELILNTFQKGNASTTLKYFDVLHGYDIGILRPDSHPSEADCLHNCDPGMVDAYNVMLLHLLRLRYEDTTNVSK